MSLANEIIKYSQNNMVYGAPITRGLFETFKSKFYSRIINGTFSFNEEELSLFEESIRTGLENNEIRWTGGSNFYTAIKEGSEFSKITNEQELEQFIRDYEIPENPYLRSENMTFEDEHKEKGKETAELSTAELIAELFTRVHSPMKIELEEKSISAIQDLVESVKKASASNKEKEYEPENYTWSRDFESEFSDEIIGVDIEKLKDLALQKRALLISGVPGTGKTKCMVKLANSLTDKTRVKIVSLGQDNMTYSDFLVGQANTKGSRWEPVDGIFLSMCKQADKDREHYYVMCIDEVGRGQTEAVLGEVITAIERRDTVINISYNKTMLIPSNLIILATRNTKDTSVARLDLALLERFSHFEMEPQWTLEYIRYISNGSKDVEAFFEMIADEVMEINEVFIQERKSHKCIGTRVITPTDKCVTLDIACDIVESQLIPAIEAEDRILSISSDGRHTVEEKLDHIIEIVNNAKV